MLYRSYENPYQLERQLASAQIALAAAELAGDADECICISEEINALRQRLSAAWEDDEAEVYGYE